jgi:hypothetical protein
VHVARVRTFQSGHYSIEFEATGDEWLNVPDHACIRYDTDTAIDYMQPGWDGVGLTVDEPGHYVGMLTLPLVDDARSYRLDYWCDERAEIPLF